MNRKMKNFLKVLIPTVMFSTLVVGIVWGKVDIKQEMVIEPELVPNAAYSVPADGNYIRQTEADIHVIPDKYNTGCTGTLTKVSGKTKINGIEFRISDGIELLDFFYANPSFSGSIMFENLDFSENSFAFNSESKVSDRKINVIFKNCKFGKVKSDMPHSDVFSYTFDNCTLIQFNGSNASFNNCQFGHSYWDCVVPYQDVHVNNCYFSDLTSSDPLGAGMHSDGTQIYANADVAAQNISFSNCRFEIPAVQPSGNYSKVNACISVDLEYNGATNIQINDCLVNGGGYSLYATQKYDYFKLSNISFDNVIVGGAKLFGTVYPKVADGVSMTNITDQDSLYVSSVWNVNGKTHVIVSNDTLSERKLRVVTINGIKDFVIPACPGGDDLRYKNFDKSFDSFPFDIDISVDDSGSYVVCYDISGKYPKQIRFVSFDGQAVAEMDFVSISENSLGGAEDDLSFSEIGSNNENDTVAQSNNYISTPSLKTISGGIEEKKTVKKGMSLEASEKANEFSEGICGRNITYTISPEGVLRISGVGDIYEYDSSKPAPWYNLADSISSVVIEEGITRIGSQAFRKLLNLEKVALPKTILTIGSNAFIGCKALKEISLHAGLVSIEKYAFNGTGLSRCTFYGTELDWNTISIGSNNDPLISSHVDFQAVQPHSQICINGKCGADLYYDLSSDGVLQISGKGKMYDYDSSKPAPWFEFADSIQKIVLEDGITEIGSQAFRKLTSIESIDIPKSVSRINANAFIGCKALKYISLFSGIKEIEKYAFNGTGLIQCTYAGSRTEWNSIIIGGFNDSLISCNINCEKSATMLTGSCGNEVSYELYENGNLLISGKGRMKDYDSAKPAPWFTYADSINNVVIEEGITGIGSQSFRKCTNLTSVSLPQTLSEIGSNAFIGCNALKTISIGMNVTSIGRYAFSGTDLQTAYYSGTQEQWKKIDVGSNNEKLINVISFLK